MTCPGCGREIPDTNDRCPACGLPSSPLTSSDESLPRGERSVARDAAGTDETLLAPQHQTGDAAAPTRQGPAHAAPPRTTAGPLEVGQQFSDRYIIVRLLGAGGMGAVYQAWDAVLSVMVALKVIRPEVTRDPVVARDIERRFKRELLLARQVTHKNVVRIHDLGEIDGVKYITMPYLEGEDLASVLKKAGRLPVTSVMPMARQIAAGLAAAHEASVVHRDLKPANIMIEDGQAIIMDFGIARTAGSGIGEPAAVARSDAGPSDDAPVEGGATVAGAVVGTVQYMAPEQALGLGVDQRADIYAFGLMLYDMLVGHSRARRAPDVELKERLDKPPPSVRSMVPDVPEALDRLVSTCIAPDVADRFQTTAELIDAIDRLDDHGNVRPIRRVVGLPLAIGVGVVLLSLSAAIWWTTRPPVVHDPVSVLIADFANTTGDPTLDGVVEPTLQLALEVAGFISAYDRLGIRRTLGVRPPARLDQDAAREIAVQNGVGVVLSGSLESTDRGYGLSVQAVRSVTGEEIVSADDVVNGKEQLLTAVTDLAAEVRRALGDDESLSAQRFAMETLSARSLDVVRFYAAAMDALSRASFDEALEGFSSAVERDPDFGLAYAGMAIASRNLDRQQDAERYAEEAVGHLDSMTERERYRTRGLFYMVTGDHQACVQEYSDLIAQYASDAAARNNLALCSTYLRDWPTALDEMRQVVAILPGRALYRENLALYLSYAGDFEAGEQEVRAMDDPGVFGLLALAFAQLGQGQRAAALDTYRTIGEIDELGASYMASGLGDLAIHEGRFVDAERLLAEGAAADLASGDRFRAAAKLAEVAHVRVLRGQIGPAVAAAEQALETSPAVKIRFLAGRVFVEAGQADRARALAADLAREFQTEPRAYAKILEGLLTLSEGEPRAAVAALMEANSLQDTWIGHFDLGRAYLEAGAFIQADSEFDRCQGRRGETLALFLDEEPTWGRLPPLYYYRGRVREALGSPAFAEPYDTYLQMRGASTEDPRVAEIRNRLNR